MDNHTPQSRSTLTSLESPILGPENALVLGLFAAVERMNVDCWRPLVLYGESGSGKSYIATTLSQSWSYADQGPLLMTAADIVRSFQPALANVELPVLRTKCTTTSLLVIDDIDQLPHRSPANDWISSILDQRLHLETPTIVSAKSLTTLRHLSKTLFSRLSVGLPIRCALPDKNTRLQIIRSTLDDPIKDANQLSTLLEQTAGLSVMGTRNFVRSASLSSKKEESHSEPDEFPKQCIAVVARRFGIPVNDIRGSSRRKNTVMARAIAMFLIREFTSLSLVDTGRCFQNRDHTTVRHACRKIKKQLASDRQMQDSVLSICTSLNLSYRSHWSATPDEQCA